MGYSEVGCERVFLAGVGEGWGWSLYWGVGVGKVDMWLAVCGGVGYGMVWYGMVWYVMELDPFSLYRSFRGLSQT